MSPTIRMATPLDLPAINAIYNHYVATSAVTFDIVALTLEQRLEWFGHYAETGRHRLLVAVNPASAAVVGYATSSRLRPKPAYVTSVETSVYAHPDALGRGLGTALYTELFDALSIEDAHRQVEAPEFGRKGGDAVQDGHAVLRVDDAQTPFRRLMCEIVAAALAVRRRWLFRIARRKRSRGSFQPDGQPRAASRRGHQQHKPRIIPHEQQSVGVPNARRLMRPLDREAAANEHRAGQRPKPAARHAE